MGLLLAKLEAALAVSANVNTTLNTGGFILLINNVVVMLSLTICLLALTFRKMCSKHLYTLVCVVFALILSLILLADHSTTGAALVTSPPEAVYSFWHKGQKRASYHLLPAWEGELAKSVEFYAFRHPAEGTMPVYDFWDYEAKAHSFHFLPMRDGEKTGEIQFYAYSDQYEGTDGVFTFSSTSDPKQHALHFKPARANEKVARIEFYAYRAPVSLQPSKRGTFEAAVPLTAFLLGIASTTLFAAFMKWYHSGGGGTTEEEAQADDDPEGQSPGGWRLPAIFGPTTGGRKDPIQINVGNGVGPVTVNIREATPDDAEDEEARQGLLASSASGTQ